MKEIVGMMKWYDFMHMLHHYTMLHFQNLACVLTSCTRTHLDCDFFNEYPFLRIMAVDTFSLDLHIAV